MIYGIYGSIRVHLSIVAKFHLSISDLIVALAKKQMNAEEDAQQCPLDAQGSFIMILIVSMQ